jgi:hypothetical protein
MTDHVPREEHLGCCCAAAAPSPRLGFKKAAELLANQVERRDCGEMGTTRGEGGEERICLTDYGGPTLQRHGACFALAHEA